MFKKLSELFSGRPDQEPEGGSTDDNDGSAAFATAVAVFQNILVAGCKNRFGLGTTFEDGTDRLLQGGWVEALPQRQSVVSKRTTAGLFAAGETSSPWYLPNSSRSAELQASHKTCNNHALSDLDVRDGVTIEETFLAHPACGTSLLHLSIREGYHADGMIILDCCLMFDDFFWSHGIDVIRSEAIWRCFQPQARARSSSSFQSAFKVRSVRGGVDANGHVHIGTRDFAHTNFVGLVADATVLATLDEIGLPIAPVTLHVNINQRIS